jgi:tripartite-type tricarboxylate transporter receptor subunit TctC
MSNKKSVRYLTYGTLFALATVFAVLPAMAAFAADAYPTKPVRLIIPQPPGGGTDIVGRIMATKLSERLGVQVIAENRVGASTIIGTEFVAKSPADGYTLLFINASYAANAALMPQKLPYNSLTAMAAVSKVADSMNMLVIHPSVPANNLKEFVALAKQKPGQLVFASQGAGTSVHLSTELFMMQAGIDLKLVQFKGGGPTVIDLLGGHSQGLVGSVTQNLIHIKSGKFKAICVFGAKRSVLLPDVPTSAEAGVAGAESGTWWGIAAPAGTPAPIIQRLDKEIKTILAAPDIKDLFLQQGTEDDYLPPAEFAAFIKGEIAKWTSVVKKANIKAEE